MSSYHIIPECYADTLLVEMLGFERPNHQLGIGSVLAIFEKQFKNRRAIGVIDDDKMKPNRFDLFEVVENKLGIKKLTKPETQHVILVISPAFEDWIFEKAKAVSVDPTKYGFRNAKYFRHQCKSVNVRDNQSVKQFLNTLKQKNAPGFVQLKSWMEESSKK